MAAQRTNSAIVFVAVLIAAVIVVFAISNRPSARNGQEEGAGGAPPPASPPIAGESDEPDVAHIDQTTDTTNPRAQGEQPPESDAGEPVVVPNLIDAAERGDMEAISSIIGSGTDLNQTDAGGRTALMAAAVGGHIDAVFALLNAGADPALRDNTRRSARDFALSRYDEPGQTIARILEDALGPTPITDPTDK